MFHQRNASTVLCHICLGNNIEVGTLTSNLFPTDIIRTQAFFPLF